MNLDENLVKLSGKSLLSIADLNSNQINSLIDFAALIKNNSFQFDYPKKNLGLIFE